MPPMRLVNGFDLSMRIPFGNKGLEHDPSEPCIRLLSFSTDPFQLDRAPVQGVILGAIRHKEQNASILRRQPRSCVARTDGQHYARTLGKDTMAAECLVI